MKSLRMQPMTLLIWASGMIALVVLLWWRVQVGYVRFFDVDEFTHLHWAANIWRGERPYLDFFTFFTPGFHFFLQPIFWIFGRSIVLFVAARWVMIALFGIALGLVTLLFANLRGWKYAIVPAILLAFLPMPYDKFFEVRPDNLALIFALAGLLLQCMALQKPLRRLWFFSGVFYGLSLIALVKFLPFAIIAIVVGIWTNRKTTSSLVSLLLGFAIPLGLFGLWLLTLGDLSTVWYSLVILPFEGNKVSRMVVMESNLFFYPNASFYGGWGMTAGLFVNHGLWLMGIVMGAYRFLTPWSWGKSSRAHQELLLGSIFFLSIIGYVEFFPLKHSQYLIPIAPFIAWYAADAIVVFLEYIWKVGRGLASIGIWVFIMVMLVTINTQVNEGKLRQTNKKQLADVASLLLEIPAETRVVDIEGRAIFWPDGYPICCLDYMLFWEYLTRRPVDLRVALEVKKVPYIYQGKSGRFGHYGAFDQAYIRDHYVPVDGWGEELWRRKP